MPSSACSWRPAKRQRADEGIRAPDRSRPFAAREVLHLSDFSCMHTAQMDKVGSASEDYSLRLLCTDLRPSAPPPELPDLTLLRVIGSGSHGEVWMARTIT